MHRTENTSIKTLVHAAISIIYSTGGCLHNQIIATLAVTVLAMRKDLQLVPDHYIGPWSHILVSSGFANKE